MHFKLEPISTTSGISINISINIPSANELEEKDEILNQEKNRIPESKYHLNWKTSVLRRIW